MAFGWKKRMETKDDNQALDGAEGRPDEVEGAEGAADRQEDDRPETAEEATVRLEAELAEATGNWQRALADYQNLRRRTHSDIDAAAKRARGEVLTEALTVLDYLDMALATECTSEDGKNLQLGVSMTRGQVASLLERFQVKEIPPSKVFDAKFHQAFATVETTEQEPGSIVEVFRKGWTLGDQVLRHAQVRVAAAPASAGDAHDGQDNPDGGFDDPGVASDTERMSD